MNLALGSTKEQAHTAKTAEAQQEAGEDVTLRVLLPADRKEPGDPYMQKTYKAGTLVACVKQDVERVAGVPYAEQKLMCGGKLLLDPLSLADCPGIAAARPSGQPVEVVVETQPAS